jgi:hypothetical protein
MCNMITVRIELRSSITEDGISHSDCPESLKSYMSCGFIRNKPNIAHRSVYLLQQLFWRWHYSYAPLRETGIELRNRIYHLYEKLIRTRLVQWLRMNTARQQIALIPWSMFLLDTPDNRCALGNLSVALSSMFFRSNIFSSWQYYSSRVATLSYSSTSFREWVTLLWHASCSSWWICILLPSEMLHSVALVRTDVSEECSTSIYRVTRICERGTMLGSTSNQRTLRRNKDIIIHNHCLY